MNPIKKVIIVEDHAIFREGLRRIVSEIDELQLVGEAPNGSVFLEMIKKEKPDLVLMDIQMPVMDGIEATEKALKLYPDLKILVLSMFGEEEYVSTMVDRGVYGFLLKTSELSDFRKAISKVSEGVHYYSDEIMEILVKKVRGLDSEEKLTLSDKESDVLRLLCRGCSNSEIADKLFISIRTVEGYRNKLLQKTNSGNILNLVLYALKHKLVTV